MDENVLFARKKKWLLIYDNEDRKLASGPQRLSIVAAIVPWEQKVYA